MAKEWGKKIDGIGAAAELLNGLDPEHRMKLMAELAARDPQTTRKLENRMFVFDDLAKLSDRDLQILLKELPHSKLVLALRRATEPLLEGIYRNMTARGCEMLREEVSSQGPKRVSDIVSAQSDLIKIAMRLADEGKITLNR